MKKIGFCFLIYDIMNQEDLWNEWFKNVDKDKYNIYIHYKNNKELKYFNQYKLDNCIPTAYRKISIVHAHNILFKKAYDDGCYKIVSLSQACIPLKSFDFVYDFLTKDDLSHFNMTVNKRGVHPRCQSVYEFIPQDKIRKSSNWFILNRNITEKIVGTSQEDINKVWGSIQFAEEHYFITTVFYNNLESQIKTTPNLASGATTFTNWHDMKHYPYVNDRYLKNYSNISSEELNYLLSQPCLFGRKFNAKCTVDDNPNFFIYDFLKNHF